jgi:hypothetical protein
MAPIFMTAGLAGLTQFQTRSSAHRVTQWFGKCR